MTTIVNTRNDIDPDADLIVEEVRHLRNAIRSVIRATETASDYDRGWLAAYSLIQRKLTVILGDE